MNREKRRRFEWAVYALVGTLAIIFLLLGTFVYTEGSLNSLMLSLSSELLGVAIIFFLVKEIFLGRPEEATDEKLDYLTSEFKKWGGSTSVQVLPTRTSIYDSGIEALRTQKWEKLRIFAPVGLWHEDLDKKRWLEEVAKKAENGDLNSVWAVFGLPPTAKNGENRSAEDVRKDLLHARDTLVIFGRLKNVTLHFYPPFPASVALGALIFENMQKTGGEFALALAVRAHEDMADTGFVINNEQVFFAVREWFDEQIFWKTTGKYVLHDSSKSIADRWNDIVRTWYGESYIKDES